MVQDSEIDRNDQDVNSVNVENDILICQKCGHENPADSSFCEECGNLLKNTAIESIEYKHEEPSEIQKEQRIEVVKDQEITSEELICPTCHKSDMIKKLSIVYEDGIKTTHSSGPRIGVGLTSEKKIGIGVGFGSDSGTSVTATSAKLAPPEEPSKGCANTIAWLLMLFGIGTIGFGKEVIFVSIVSFVIGLAIKLSVNKKYQDQKEDYFVTSALWDSMYYCGRDETVFEPSLKVSMDANKLQAFLKHNN